MLGSSMTDSQEKLDQYRQQLVGCAGRKCDGVFQKVADSYEDDLLEFAHFPDDYFSFVLEILSEAEFYAKPGAWNFLLVLGTERGKLQAHHYRALADCMMRNYEHYTDEDLCLAVCDFVARNYSSADAKLIFDRLAAIEAKKPNELHGFVSDGLRILAAEEKRSGEKPA